MGFGSPMSEDSEGLPAELFEDAFARYPLPNAQQSATTRANSGQG